MHEGKTELNDAIQQWQRRHDVAARAKREAEIVLPFLRAAVEELDSFNEAEDKVQDEDTGAEPVRIAPVGAVAAPKAVPTEVPEEPVVASIDTDEEAEGEEGDDSDADDFGHTSIAALLDTGEKEAAS